MPKGVMMSQAHMLASARMFCHLTGFGSDDVLYSCFPVHHVFSSVTGILATLCAGGSMTLGKRFSARNFWPRVRRYEATIIHVLDAPANILLALPESDLDRVHQCRVAYTTATRLPEFTRRFGVPILPLFDMSELTVVAYYPEGAALREGSCGLASGLFDIAILDEHDAELKPGEEGELAVRPRVPHVMALGYFDDSELTLERSTNLWFHTGDLAVVDEDGYLYFRGRAGDRIRRRGTNISASQIEAIAAMHPAVAEAAAIGVPAGVGEDDIKLAVTVQPESDLTPEDLYAWLVTQLPKALLPQYLEIRGDFPRTQTEKIRKNVLREEGGHGLTPTTWEVTTAAFVVPQAS
jgi:crotonobetaine/carnitine-CoA ligase